MRVAARRLLAVAALAAALPAGGAPGLAATPLPDPYPAAGRAYAVAINAQMLWAHEPGLRLPPASLAKLLTALVLLEDRAFLTRSVPVTAAAAATAPTRAGLRAGDALAGEQALAAMLVHSANDACRALVAQAAPSTAAFAARMNARAAALGMRDSHFVDPCGYDADDQFSTAADLLLLARAAHEDPLIARYAAQATLHITTRAGRSYQLANTNQLLGRLPGVVGLKTGYTAQARQCLIAVADRDGRRVWLVLLGGAQRWWLAHRMINGAFDVAAVESR